MTTNYNLSSHYSSNAKTDRPQRLIVSAPEKLPVPHLFNDRDANNRMKAINNDIYQGLKQEKQKDGTNFVKGFIAVLLGIFTVLGIKKIFK